MADEKIDTWQDLKPQGAYAIVYSEEVTLTFREPIFLDSLYVQASKSYLTYYSHLPDRGSAHATFYIKTYEDEELVSERTFRADGGSGQRIETWTKVQYPPKGFAKVNRIVLSRGLEIDNIKFLMHIDVPLQVVRLDASDTKRLSELSDQGVKIINQDEVIKQ